MRSARVTSAALLAEAIVGGLVLQAADEPPAGITTDAVAVQAGTAMPAARAEPTLASTWYCAGGTGAAGSVAEHGLIIANPTTRPRTATITALSHPYDRPGFFSAAAICRRVLFETGAANVAVCMVSSPLGRSTVRCVEILISAREASW